MSARGACNWITVWVKDFYRFVFHAIPYSVAFVSVAFLSGNSHLQIVRAQLANHRLRIESANVEAHTALRGESTGGISNTVSTLSLVSSFPS
jgi:hypothetical protein